MFENEEWRTVEELPHYLISNYGRVKHIDRINARNITVNERGFPVVLLNSANTATRYNRQINHLVAHAFLPQPEYSNMTSVWHIDGDLINCRADNLKWETRPRVLEWNEMHRTLTPRLTTPPVKNNRTGVIYNNAFECGMAEGRTESEVVWRIENAAGGLYDESSRYMYVD